MYMVVACKIELLGLYLHTMISYLKGSDIKILRLERGISQAKLADLSSIVQAKISSWELEKEDIPEDIYTDLVRILSNIDDKKVNQIKKKRYQKFQNNEFKIPQRNYKLTSRNVEYLESLTLLEERFKENNYKAKALSFFAGCGGLCYGAKAAGIDIVGTNELINAYKEVYSLNFPNSHFLPNDVRQIKKSDIDEVLEKHGKIDIMLGGPPCQGFSLAGKRDVNDERNSLFGDYLEISKYVNPKVILIENVKLLTSMKDPDGRFVRDRIIETYQQLGYDSQFYIVNAKNYGVPQHRERVIFIGVRSDLKQKPSIPDHIYSDEPASLFNDVNKPFTFGDGVSDLPYIESGEKVDNDPYHWAVSHPNHVLEWMVDVPQGRSAHDNENPSLRPPSGYNTTYKRQVWDEPAGTVATTFGMISGCRNVHPIATRSMTIREALRLQSFPDSFKLIGTSGTRRTVIGNAVPPMLGYHIAKHIVDTYM